MLKKEFSVAAARILLFQATATKDTVLANPEGKTSICRENRSISMQEKEIVCQKGVYMCDLDHM